MKVKITFSIYSFIAILLIISTNLFAQQNLSFLRVSPKATVMQNVGFAKIQIDYSRPAVKGRQIWGKLVPYGLAPNGFGNGKPMPWRAGANENSVISISNDCKVNGKELKAGKYGIHMVVQEDEWTIIFSKDHNAWGSFFYDQSNDALRIKSKPIEAPFEEWLMFGFDNLTSNSAEAFLHWGKVKVPFKIEFDINKITLDFYRKELTNLAGFNSNAWAQAAQFCLTNKINIQEAESWIDKALKMNGGNTFSNKSIKAGFLRLAGKDKEAEDLMNDAFNKATEAQINAYGYQIMNSGKIDKAIEIFKMNVKNHPKSWNAYDSLAEALSNKGNKKLAKEYYEKAYQMAPANQKTRIESVLKTL